MDEQFNDLKQRMESAIEVFKREIASLRTGRASVALLDGIKVDYYGTPTPLNQLATLSAPESRLLTVQPWDPTALPLIEKAIRASDLGLTPNSDGKMLRLSIPMMTEERRRELVKHLKKRTEECRVAIRNVRREGNEDLKARQKNKQLTEDDLFKAQEKVQKLTDQFINQVDDVAARKEKEILEIS